MIAAIPSIKSGSFSSSSSWASKRSKKVCQAGAKRKPLVFVRRLWVKLKRVWWRASSVRSNRITDSVSQFGSCGCGSICHSCSKLCGGFHIDIRPVLRNPIGTLMYSMLPPERVSILAVVLNHMLTCFGSVMAFHTISGRCGSCRSYRRVV